MAIRDDARKWCRSGHCRRLHQIGFDKLEPPRDAKRRSVARGDGERSGRDVGGNAARRGQFASERDRKWPRCRFRRPRTWARRPSESAERRSPVRPIPRFPDVGRAPPSSPRTGGRRNRHSRRCRLPVPPPPAARLRRIEALCRVRLRARLAVSFASSQPASRPIGRLEEARGVGARESLARKRSRARSSAVPTVKLPSDVEGVRRRRGTRSTLRVLRTRSVEGPFEPPAANAAAELGAPMPSRRRRSKRRMRRPPSRGTRRRYCRFRMPRFQRTRASQRRVARRREGRHRGRASSAASASRARTKRRRRLRTKLAARRRRLRHRARAMLIAASPLSAAIVVKVATCAASHAASRPSSAESRSRPPAPRPSPRRRCERARACGARARRRRSARTPRARQTRPERACRVSRASSGSIRPGSSRSSDATATPSVP
jgi:hypothetical protein